MRILFVISLLFNFLFTSEETFRTDFRDFLTSGQEKILMIGNVPIESKDIESLIKSHPNKLFIESYKFKKTKLLNNYAIYIAINYDTPVEEIKSYYQLFERVLDHKDEVSSIVEIQLTHLTKILISELGEMEDKKLTQLLSMFYTYIGYYAEFTETTLTDNNVEHGLYVVIEGNKVYMNSDNFKNNNLKVDDFVFKESGE